jgi:Tfp pilus assembly protein FimT
MLMISATGTCERRARRRGFTLIELSIVAFILMIVLAVSAPYFARSYRATQLDAAVRSFITTCQFARHQAILNQRPAYLHLDIGGRMVWVSQERDGEFGEPVEHTLKTLEIAPVVSIVSVQLAGELPRRDGQVTVVFYPNGTCDALAMVLQGSEKGSGLHVFVDPVTTKPQIQPMKL